MSGPRLVSHPRSMRALAGTRAILPGLGLCVAFTAAAVGFEAVETHLFGRAWLEALVLAILLGSAIRTAWTPSQRFFPGIAFGAKTVLEIAVVMLGASLSLATILAAGPGLLFGIAGVVVVAILSSYGIGRGARTAFAHGDPRRLRQLDLRQLGDRRHRPGDRRRRRGRRRLHRLHRGAGRAGGARPAAAGAAARLSPMQYGVLAGLTVYAVPQVLAATAPVAALSVQVGTLVKLVRVLMLGPVVLMLSLGASRLREETDEAAPGVTAGDRPARGGLAIQRLVPWFILAFLALAGLSLGRADPADRPRADVGDRQRADRGLDGGALGLGVDVRSVAKAGARVTLAVVASLLALGAVSLGLIHVLGLV